MLASGLVNLGVCVRYGLVAYASFLFYYYLLGGLLGVKSFSLPPTEEGLDISYGAKNCGARLSHQAGTSRSSTLPALPFGP